MMGNELRTVVLRLLHAALAWFLPHARALYTRLENLTRQAASTSGRADRDARAELDLALRALIDRAEARLASRVGATVAFVQSLLTRLTSTVRDRVSRTESVIHGLTADRAALHKAAKAARLAQARAEITSRAAMGRARKLTRRMPAVLARRGEMAGYLAKAGSALAFVFAFATGVAAAARTRITAAQQSATARREARLRAIAEREAAGPQPQQRTRADGVVAEGEAAQPVADDARPGVRPGAVADWVAAEGGAARAAVDAALLAARLRAAAQKVVAEGEPAQTPALAFAVEEEVSPRVAVAGQAAAGDCPEVGLAALLAGIEVEPIAPVRVRVPRPARVRVPDAVRVVLAAAMVLAVIAGVGLWAGSLGDDGEKTVQAQPSSAAPALPVPTPTFVEAAGPVEAAPRIVPLSQRNPITGPDRPPLPDDEAGPYGSRHTTGTYEVALTFDDGPDPRYTPEVLALLRQYHIKATFCLIGVNVVEFPHLVRAIADEGHTLCNHSWVHDTGLGTRSYSTIASDMSRTTAAIKAAAPGSRVSYFRHPGGAWTQAAVTSARQQGMTSLHWDVDPRDWLRPGPRAISNFVTGSTQPGSIVLLHDGGGDRLGTVEALHSILPNLVSRLWLVALPPGIDPPRLHGIHLPIHAGQQ